MNDLLDLATKTRNSVENAVTLRVVPSQFAHCRFSGFEYGNSAVFVHVCDHVISDQAQEALFRISRFTGLKENWDSYGASTIGQATVEAAKRFVVVMDRKGVAPYFVSPGPNGEVLVEFRMENGKEAEVYFHDDGTRRLLLIDGKEFPFEGDYNAQEFLKHVGLSGY